VIFDKIKSAIAEILKFFGVFKPVHRFRIGIIRHFEEKRSGGISSKDLVITRTAGDHPEKTSKALCVFASFDQDSLVDEYVVYYLSELKKQLSVDIVFVTTSASLAESELKKLKPYCRTIIHRKNISIDFGSWKVALDETPDWSQYETLVIANDSVYGPLADLNAVVQLLDPAKPMIAGVTESLQYTRHLQSYFLVLNSKAIHSEFFKDFWGKFSFTNSKKLIIQDGEIGFSQRALEAGIELKALFPYEPLLKKAIASEENSYLPKYLKKGFLNPTHHLWRALLREKTSPFIKIELLKKNPSKLPDLDRLMPELKGSRDYSSSLIESHLRRTATPVK
jgi:lipopolysaccharide biosynthesis protein